MRTNSKPGFRWRPSEWPCFETFQCPLLIVGDMFNIYHWMILNDNQWVICEIRFTLKLPNFPGVQPTNKKLHS